MNIAETYISLSQIMEYPENKKVLREGIENVIGALQDRGIPCALEPFARFVARSTLASIQEDYIATFDFNLTVALYLGHHLYRDNQKRAQYMIGIKEKYRRQGFTPPENELPDFLPVLFRFLAHLAPEDQREMRTYFISESLLPGIERLTAGFGRKDSPWKHAVEASLLFCYFDAAAPKEEITPC